MFARPLPNHAQQPEQKSRASLIVQLVNVAHELLDRAAARAVVPFSTIPNATHFACESDGTTLCDVVLSTPLDTGPEQIYAFAFVADARIELGEVEAVLEGAFLDEVSVGYIGVVGNHAVGESE